LSERLGSPRPVGLHAGLLATRHTNSIATGRLHFRGGKPSLAATPRSTASETPASSARGGELTKRGTLPCLAYVSVCACVGARAHGFVRGCVRVHTAVMAMVATGTATTTRWPGRQAHERKKDREQGCARGDDGGGTCKNLSLPGPMAGVTSGVRGGAVADTEFPPGSRPGHPQMSGETVLTLVASGRSEGIGEGAERGSSTTKVMAAVRVEGVGDVEVAGTLCDGRSSSSSRAAPVFAANDAPLDGLRSSSPFSPPSPSPASGRCGQGRVSPKAARVGSSRGAAAVATYSGRRARAHGRRGCAGRRVVASQRRPLHGGARPTSVTKGEMGEDDDDDDIMATSAHDSLVSVYERARGVLRCPAGAWAALGPKGATGQKRGWRPMKVG
jgi:hypothetical protein